MSWFTEPLQFAVNHDKTPEELQQENEVLWLCVLTLLIIVLL